MLEYIALINDTGTDKVDIIYSGTDKDKGLELLWERYRELVNDRKPDNLIFYRDVFAERAMSGTASAYAMYPGRTVKYELHEIRKEQ